MLGSSNSTNKPWIRIVHLICLDYQLIARSGGIFTVRSSSTGHFLIVIDVFGLKELLSHQKKWSHKSADTICHTCMILSSETEQITQGSLGFHVKSEILAVWPPWMNSNSGGPSSASSADCSSPILLKNDISDYFPLHPLHWFSSSLVTNGYRPKAF